MGVIKSAVKAGIVVKLIDVLRREAAKPENQQKAREMVERLRREAAKPENQRKVKEMLDKLGKGPGKTPRTP